MVAIKIEGRNMLAALPVELVERIVTSLDTKEVGLLRLVSRELRDKASQGCYLTLFTDRSVDLTEDGLEGLIRALAVANLARKLRNLTLVSVVYSPRSDGRKSPSFYWDNWAPPSQTMLHKEVCPSKLKQSQSDKRFAQRKDAAELRLQQAKHHFNVERGLYPQLLRAALDSIKMHRLGTGLECLRLSIAVQTSMRSRFSPDAMEQRCASSEESYLLATTLGALSATNLHVRHFDAFSRTRLCSIACPELAAWLSMTPAPSIRSFGLQLRSLSLSFSCGATNSSSNICCNCNGRKYRDPKSENLCHLHRCKFNEDDDNSCSYESSLAAFLSNFPNLETLDLHEYMTVWVSTEDDWNTAAFEGVASRVRLPLLRECVLRGINLTESSLFTFLKNTPSLVRLTLTHVNLAEGVWTPILDHVRTMQKLQHLELTDLFENKRGETLSASSAVVPPPFPPIPPPPPPIFPPGVVVLPHNIEAQTETYINTLLGFRPANVPKSECFVGGCFGSNKVVLSGMWISKAVLTYSNIGHDNAKPKVEGRWDRERIREYGPSTEIFNDLV